ncbi:MAG: hypothetical protein P4L98_16340 [Ancalomicrobiaceae bacterium]|nr:hypothetical protein [Ancalomicrobiaceae bacterium]
MRQFILISAFMLASTATAFAGPQVGGEYKVKGTNFDGSAYSGTATITPASNSTCRIVWKTGGTTSTGFCMRNDDSLAAAYKLGAAVGLVIYHIEDDGTLDGVWTIADKAGAGTEVLTPR